MERFSTEYLNKTIEVWQPFSDVPLSPKDALEITDNMTALFNFLIVSENKSNEKSINKNIA